MKKGIKIFLYTIVAIMLLPLLIISSIKIIPTNNIGIQFSIGQKFEKIINNEGIGFYNPFSFIKLVSLRNENTNLVVEKYAKDGVLKITFNFNKKYNFNKIKELKVDNKIDDNILIHSCFGDATEKILSQYNIIDIMKNRTEINEKIKKELENILEKQNYYVISNIIIADIDFPEEVEKSLQQRVLINQALEKEKSKTLIIEEQNKQKLIEARTEAEAIKIKNEALKNNEQIIKLNFIEKWDGKLPTTISSDVLKMMH